MRVLTIRGTSSQIYELIFLCVKIRLEVSSTSTCCRQIDEANSALDFFLLRWCYADGIGLHLSIA